MNLIEAPSIGDLARFGTAIQSNVDGRGVAWPWTVDRVATVVSSAANKVESRTKPVTERALLLAVKFPYLVYYISGNWEAKQKKRRFVNYRYITSASASLPHLQATSEETTASTRHVTAPSRFDAAPMRSNRNLNLPV